MGKNKDLIKNSHNKEQLVDKKDINKSQLVDGTKSSVKSKPIDDEEDFLSVRDHSHRIVLEKTEVMNPDTSDKGFKADKTDVKTSVKGEKSKLKKTIHKNNLKNIRKKLSEQANVQDKEEKNTEEHYSKPVRTETYVQQTVLNQSDKAFSVDSGYADSLIQRGSDTLVKSSATSDIVNTASVLSAGINKDKKIRSKKRRKNNSAQVEQKNNTPIESSPEQKSDYQSADTTEKESTFEYRENTAYSDIKSDHTVKTDIKSEHQYSVNELNVRDSLSANVKDNIKTDTSPKTKQSAYKKNIRKRQKADFIRQSAKQRDISYRNEADRPDIQTSIVYTDKAGERIRENIGRIDNRQRDITYNSERNENFSFLEQGFDAESIINTPDVTENSKPKPKKKQRVNNNHSEKPYDREINSTERNINYKNDSKPDVGTNVSYRSEKNNSFSFSEKRANVMDTVNIKDTADVKKQGYNTFTYKSEADHSENIEVLEIPVEYAAEYNSAQLVQNKSSELPFEIKNKDKTREINKGTINTSVPDDSNKEPLQNKPDKNSLDTVNTRNVQHISSAEAVKIADSLGIKTSFSDKVKSSFVKEAEILKNGLIGVSSFAAKSGVKAGYNAIKENISVSAEETPEAAGIDVAVKTADTAKTTSDVYNGTKQTAKNIKDMPKKTTETVRKGIEQVKSMQRKYQKMKQLRKSGQKTAKIIGEAVMYAVKGTATTALAAILPVFCLIVIIAAIFGFVLSCMWDTSSDLDTTKIIKWVSELDFKRQEHWYSKGKTGIEIDKNNSGEGKSIYYHYLCAVDVPQDFIGTNDTPITTNCVIKLEEDSEGKLKKPSYSTSIFTEDFSSKDEMLENFRWTTDDYLAALAFLQVKNNNLGWIESVLGFVGSAKLKQSWQLLHNQTFDKPMVVEYTDKDGNVKYTYPSEYETNYSTDSSKTTYYFFRKYSVNYLIENNIVKFDDTDEIKNNAMKEQYRNIYKYGNIGLVNLGSPVELEDDETIEDRIIKHFGKQLVIKYDPPTSRDPDREQWGSISKSTGTHYAIDIQADYGDRIYSPINGLCKVTGREGRNLEYTISTSYNGSDFDFTKTGYVIKISCSRGSFIPLNAPTLVTKGQLIGTVDRNVQVNTTIPDKGNDTENEDIFADKLFPCCTATDYSSIGSDEFNVPPPVSEHIHMEMYRLPCDFTSASDMEENVLDPELFFDHSGER